jgi:F-type H+-transporting ATPase subunit b
MARDCSRWAGLALTLIASAAPLLAAEEGHGGGTVSVFAGGPGNSIITLIILGVVVWILGKYAWPPLLDALDERERSIREALEKAKREREASERLLHEYEAKLNQARNEATRGHRAGGRGAARRRGGPPPDSG